MRSHRQKNAPCPRHMGRPQRRHRFGRHEAATSGTGQQELSCARVLLMGAPNVGKSVIFHRLTGVYVTVSNYPGTTVEVSKGYMRWADRLIEVVDTPGMYSLRPVTEEEYVARRLLLREHTDVILHVLDSKNIGRMLTMTLELMETGIPVIVVANMLDEAQRLGFELNFGALQERLGAPVIPTSAVEGVGLDSLRDALRVALASHA